MVQHKGQSIPWVRIALITVLNVLSQTVHLWRVIRLHDASNSRLFASHFSLLQNKYINVRIVCVCTPYVQKHNKIWPSSINRIFVIFRFFFLRISQDLLFFFLIFIYRKQFLPFSQLQSRDIPFKVDFCINIMAHLLLFSSKYMYDYVQATNAICVECA